jgi:putative heme-binding domain-containing protein
MTVFTMKDGSAVAGRISQENDSTAVVMTNPFDPSVTSTVAIADVKSREFSKASLMPPGLLNTLSEDEILDLIAYLESAGDPSHPNFSK